MLTFSNLALLESACQMSIRTLELIPAGVATDARGELRYCNDLPLDEFVRFYTIQNKSVGFVRGWHGHKIEAKAIIPLAGKIRVGAARVDDWANPSKDCFVGRFDLDADNPQALLIPGGFANAIVSLTPGALVGVFSSSSLEESLADDFRFRNDYWEL